MSQLLIYKASAGSGKTFTLAVEYIKLLIQNPYAYRRILAVTFTNKATTEMKERILSQLYGIGVGDPESEPYLNRIMEECDLPKEEIRKRAHTALSTMIHDYSRFRVETIDSFFQSVMRNLARELELSPNLNVELNNSEVLSNAVDAMIEKLEQNSPTMVMLLNYINESIKNDKRWNVSDEIKKFGKHIFNEEYMEKGADLHTRLKDPTIVKEYKEELEKLMEMCIEQMNEYADCFEEELNVFGLTPDELKSGKRGICSYFKKIKEGNYSSDIRNATVEKSLNTPEEWGTKTKPRYQEIVDLAASTLMPLLNDTEKARQKYNIIVNSCRLSLQHLNKLQLLARIDDEVRELNKENNSFLLSDTNALLHRLIGDGDSSFIFEKIGTHIHHVMIDEFQDTSRMQWGNFKLLLLEGLAQGSDSLIVGDVKQSIYRWRNGDWGILNSLNDTLGTFAIEVRTLNTNRRSESRIIGFNNTFFTHAVGYLNSVYESEFDKACEPLIQAYKDVKQESPKSVERGYIKVNFVEPDEEHNYTELTLIELGEEVKRLFSAGVKPGDIAILVRKNKAIPQIADYFDKELQCKIVSDEAFLLNASLAIEMMIDALRLLSSKANSVALAKLAINYQNKVLGNNLSINDLLVHNNPYTFLPPTFAERHEELRTLPLYELLEELFIMFNLEQIPHQDAYLFAFFDAVIDYLQNHSADLDAFIAHWDKVLFEKKIPGGEIEGIRIFSIHKSKGLEFHTVLVPFCDWKLENETNDQLLWCVPDRSPYNQLSPVPVSYSKTMYESIYSNDYLHERLQLWVDNLNILYVAFTRAGKNLIVWTQQGKKNTICELLEAALHGVSTELNTPWNNQEPFEWGELCLSDEAKEKQTTNRLLQKPQKLPIVMKSARHDITFRQSNRSADFIRGIDEENSHLRLIDRGNLLHTLFSGIHTQEDIEPAIAKLIFEGIIADKETEEEIRGVAKKAFSHPQVKLWYSGEWRLFNECAIIYKEDGKVQTRRPDRVMVKEGLAVVVDFKFGKPEKRHARQVRSYMNLLQRMGYAHTEGYIWYVEEEEVMPVETLHA